MSVLSKLDTYILGPGRSVLPEPDRRRWCDWMSANEAGCRVSVTHPPGYAVRTSFVGLDYRLPWLHHRGGPLVFQTTVIAFVGPEARCEIVEVHRCETWLDALRTHEGLVDLLVCPATVTLQ